LSTTKDIDDRKIVRNRYLAVKEQKSSKNNLFIIDRFMLGYLVFVCLIIIKIEERAKAVEDREARLQKEITDRKLKKEDERRDEMKRFEEMSKTSTADRIHTDSSNRTQDTIKEKAKAAEIEKKK
jgi:biopolymer transport protein ExbB/TolQ